MDRRTLLARSLTAMAGLPLVSARLPAPRPTPPPPFTDAHLATLKAIAAIVLPSALGRAGTDEAVDGFVRWIKGYRAGADEDHGYGFTRLRATGPSPLPAYVAQLKALDRHAGEGRTFAGLPAARQRTLIERSLASMERLPLRPDGKNLIADVMGFYLHSSEANDLCYRAAIGRDTCRGLPGSTGRPARQG